MNTPKLLVSIVRGFAAAFLLAIVTLPASAATYYVSTSGSDSNSGTSTSRPWKTITKVNSRGYAAGDQILFRGGQTFSGNLRFTTTTTGTDANRVTVSTYGTGKATINAGSGRGISIENIAGITVNNLIVSGSWSATSQSGNTDAGIICYTARTDGVRLAGVTLSNCEVKGFKSGGIYIASGSANNSQSGFSNVLISACAVHDNGHVGISSYGPIGTAGETAYAHANLRVVSCNVYLNQGIKNFGNHSGNGILLGQVDGATVEHCVAYQNGLLSNYVYAGPAAIWAWDSRAVVFQYNEAHHNGTGIGTIDGDGFDFDGAVTDSVMQYNYSHDNQGAGFMLYEFGALRGNNRNNTIRYNISQNDCTVQTTMGGIFISGNATDNLVYNNTVYNAARPPLRISGGDQNWIINNILFSDGSSNHAAYLESNACWLFNNNYWPGSGTLRIHFAGTTLTSLAALQATGNEMLNGVGYGFSVNPLLSNPGNGGTVATGGTGTLGVTPSALSNYRRLAGSPMTGAAFDLTSLGLSVGATNYYLTPIPPFHVGAD